MEHSLKRENFYWLHTVWTIQQSLIGGTQPERQFLLVKHSTVLTFQQSLIGGTQPERQFLFVKHSTVLTIQQSLIGGTQPERQFLLVKHSLDYPPASHWWNTA